MKSYLTLFLLLFAFSLASAQSFKDGLKAYENGNYTVALEAFKAGKDQQSQVFTGKTLFNLNALNEARFILINSLSGTNLNLQADAKYTLAQIAMINGFAAQSLDYLIEIQQQNSLVGNLKNDSKRLYDSYVSYLTFTERVSVLKQTQFTTVLEDIIREGIRVESKLNATSLINFAVNLSKQGSLNDEFLNEIKTAYLRKSDTDKLMYPNSPEGFSYTIGVLLPNEDKRSESFLVSKSLYQGIQTAVEEFNSENRLNKVFLKHISIPDTSNVIANLAYNESVDLIIGPLTSEGAKNIVQFAEEFEIPMIAPLANNDSLNIDNPYFFQINPAFKTRGKRMAEYAISNLKVDTVAIMVERKSMGYLSAVAFKEEMERRNVYVAYFFAEDFEASGFDISEYTKYFTSDPLMRDSLDIPVIDAVYFPYTGAQSETLIDLTLTDLEAGKSEFPVLGSQDWGYIEITPERLRKFEIYFPDAIVVDEKSEKVIQFRQNYSDVTKGSEVDYFSILGYDIATYGLQVIHDVKNPNAIKFGIKHKPKFFGLGNEIYFNSTHVNQSLTIYKMSKDGIVKVSN